jgi:hypothetical protein
LDGEHVLKKSKEKAFRSDIIVSLSDDDVVSVADSAGVAYP